MQAGTLISVKLRAAKPDGSLVRGPAIAAFSAPGKDPEHVPADRVPDREVPLAFDEDSRTYGGEVSSKGWLPGTWTMSGMVLSGDGTPAGWGWYTFTVDP